MTEIKAIETVYNGYRFRSRLEARWAVFFDELGIKYEYEPEGIVLSDKTKYLPDFYLPEFNCFFEVKRKGIENTEEGKIAIEKIADGSNSDSWAGIICFGDPVDDDIRIFCQEFDDGGGGSYEGEITIGLHPNNNEPYFFAYNDRRERTFLSSFAGDVIPMVTEEYGSYKYKDFVSDRVNQARMKARQARFEHGEKPNSAKTIFNMQDARNYRMRITQMFIDEIKCKDRNHGGNLNMCDWNTIREQFSIWKNGVCPETIFIERKDGTVYESEVVMPIEVHTEFSQKRKAFVEHCKQKNIEKSLVVTYGYEHLGICPFCNQELDYSHVENKGTCWCGQKFNMDEYWDSINQAGLIKD